MAVSPSLLSSRFHVEVYNWLRRRNKHQFLVVKEPFRLYPDVLLYRVALDRFRCYHSERNMRRRSSIMSNTEHTQTGFAEVNSTTLYYEVAGDGHPFILIHGHLLDRRSWDRQFGFRPALSGRALRSARLRRFRVDYERGTVL